MSLVALVSQGTVRGECKCGRCADVGTAPDPTGHTVDMVFIIVGLSERPPSREEFLAATRAHEGVFTGCDPLDGKEHGYIELGGWIGDQMLALRYMALGTILGVFDLFTPRNQLRGLPDELIMQMATAGLVTVQLRKETQ